MKRLFETIAERLKDGEPLVLATVVKSAGSSPRGAGARMLVPARGKTLGTVGGGAVEYESERHARELLLKKRSDLVTYNLTKSQVADLGMICGGRVTVLFQYLAPEDGRMAALFFAAAEAASGDTPMWLITRLSGTEVTDVGLTDGDTLRFASETTLPELRPYLWNKPVFEQGDVSYFCDPFARDGKVYVFGGGHVAQQLVPVLSNVEFRVTVVEDRPEFCTKALFPSAELLLVEEFESAVQRIRPTANDAIVVMTRGHQADYEVLEQALRTDAYYIGCIGSHHKVALTKKRLLAAGVAEEKIERLHSPIGLAIKAETPAEIAISIAGEMILCRAER